DPDLVLRRELEDAAVLQVAAEHRADQDGLRQVRHARPQRADAAYQTADRDTVPGRVVQRVDDLFVDQAVHLDPDAGPIARARRGRLLLDPLDEAVAHVLRGYQQRPVDGLAAVAGQHVEQVGQIGPDLRLRGQQADVLVEPGGLRVVVARADVAVAAQPVGLLA